MEKLKDHSRFNRWVARLDENDRHISPRRRKRKWLGILALGISLFALSFLLTPSIGMKYPTPEILPKTEAGKDLQMPVDSFENQLKDAIHERLSEKE